MLILGLTGQSGAGKGVFSDAVKEKDGVHVIDTDVTAREVVKCGEKCLNELACFFGGEILQKDGSLDRKRLAELAFSDEEKHGMLNKITHCHIMKKIEEWLDECRKNGAICAVVDAPLLFESGADKLCNVTVGIIAPYEKRLERIISRDGLDEKSARLRLDAQPDDVFFREKCDYILENTGSQAEFKARAKQLVDGLLKE